MRLSGNIGSCSFVFWWIGKKIKCDDVMQYRSFERFLKHKNLARRNFIMPTRTEIIARTNVGKLDIWETVDLFSVGIMAVAEPEYQSIKVDNNKDKVYYVFLSDKPVIGILIVGRYPVDLKDNEVNVIFSAFGSISSWYRLAKLPKILADKSVVEMIDIHEIEYFLYPSLQEGLQEDGNYKAVIMDKRGVVLTELPTRAVKVLFPDIIFSCL